MNPVTNTVAPATFPAVASSDAVRLLQLSASLELTRMEAKELREKYIALLPFATDDQFNVVKLAAAQELDLPEGCKVNVDFKLSLEQETILRDVREDRKKHLMANRDTLMAGILADTEQKLVSLKVRVGPKKTTTTCRFEKSSVKASGLIAHLREMADKQ